MKLTVFYSWQSDRPNKLCRDFIGTALSEAATRLSSRRDVQILVDSDTKGVPGTPPITDTILKKIETCDVFLADMSFVAVTDAEKHTPNLNVMGEFGYALKAKGWKRILLAMNTTYGEPTKLPFDLGHFRFPTTYDLATEKPDTARRTARARFSERLEQNIEAVLDYVLANSPAALDLLQALEERTIATQNARVSNNPPVLVSQPSAYVYLVPAAVLDPPAIDLKKVQAFRHLVAPPEDHGGQIGQDHTQWWAHGPTLRLLGKPNPEARWVARLLRPGIVEQVFNIGQSCPGDQETLVNGFTLEKEIVSRVDRSLEMLEALGLHGPTLISISLTDLEKVHLTGAPPTGQFKTQRLRLQSALMPEGGRRSGNVLHEAFHQLCLAAGGRDGSLSFANSDEWAGYLHDNAY